MIYYTRKEVNMINKAMTLYLDTSVIGGYLDKEFEESTKQLFENIKAGKYIAFISNLVNDELIDAPDKVRNILTEINYNSIKVTPECENLADEYIKENVVGATSKEDCVHIAIATINNIDVLVSWNFKHIVNVQRIRGYNYVNLKNGYKQLDIRSPKEVMIYELG
jgi:predicted nucleic acid-binding protein